MLTIVLVCTALAWLKPVRGSISVQRPFILHNESSFLCGVTFNQVDVLPAAVAADVVAYINDAV